MPGLTGNTAGGPGADPYKAFPDNNGPGTHEHATLQHVRPGCGASLRGTAHDRLDPAGKHTMLIRRLFRVRRIATEPDGASAGSHALRRMLGPVDLILLGIGGIVGAGIFALVGTAAAGDAARPGAGPALVVSFLLTGVACALTALCYAEFASMVPISGSAYTYAYATLGEIVAWIIGWDLVLEYAVGNIAVAVSWSGYFCEFPRLRPGVSPLGWPPTCGPRWARRRYSTLRAPAPGTCRSSFNLPAVFIVDRHHRCCW